MRFDQNTSRFAICSTSANQFIPDDHLVPFQRSPERSFVPCAPVFSIPPSIDFTTRSWEVRFPETGDYVPVRSLLNFATTQRRVKIDWCYISFAATHVPMSRVVPGAPVSARALSASRLPAAMATLEEEVLPILKATSRHERAAPVRSKRGSSPDHDGCRQFSGGGDDHDTECGRVSSFSRSTSRFSRGARLAAAISSVALVGLACLVLRREDTGGVRLGHAAADSQNTDATTKDLVAPRVTHELIALDPVTGRFHLKLPQTVRSVGGKLDSHNDDGDRSPLPHQPASLGMDHALGDECAFAVRDPENWGPNPAFTDTLIGLLPYAAQSYVVCSSHCDMPIPPSLFGKVKMVHGFEVDNCLALQTQTHWIKASLSHGAAVAHAKARGLESLAVLEEDMTAEPAPYTWVMRDYQALNAVLEGAERDNWNVLRLGYRPVDHEGPSPVGCAAQCACDAVTSTLCYMRNTQCQLHSSDAYILRNTMYDYVLGMVSAGGVIDFGVLQGIPNQIVITPQITFQTGYATESDRTDLGTQLATTGRFYDACMKPVLSANAALGGGTTGSAGLDEAEVSAWKRNTTPEAVDKMYAASLGNTQPAMAGLGKEAGEVSEDVVVEETETQDGDDEDETK